MDVQIQSDLLSQLMGDTQFVQDQGAHGDLILFFRKISGGRTGETLLRV